MMSTWAAPTLVSSRVSPVFSPQIKHTTGGVEASEGRGKIYKV